MAELVDLVKVHTTTVGIGALALSVAVDGFRGPEALTDGAAYHYSIQQGSNFEYGTGVWDADASSLSRSVIRSQEDGVQGTDPIALNWGAEVSFVALAEDIGGGGGGSDINDNIISTTTTWSSDKSVDTFANAEAVDEALGQKQNSLPDGDNNQFLRGDKTFFTLLRDDLTGTGTGWSSEKIAEELGTASPLTGTLAGGRTNPRDTYIAGNVGYQPDSTTFGIFDVTKSPPELLSSSSPPFSPQVLRGVAVQGIWAFLPVQGSQASPGAAIDVWNVADPSNPVHVTRKASSNLINPAFCTIMGPYLLVADIRIGGTNVDLNGRIVVFDTTDPANMIERGVWNAPIPTKAARFATQGFYAYVPLQGVDLPDNLGALTVVDFRNPDAPTQVGTVSIETNAVVADCFVQGGYVYLASEGLGGFITVDITDPSNPVVVNSVRMPEPPDPPPGYTPESTGITVNGNSLYVMDLIGDLVHQYDISDPVNPVFVKTGDEGMDTPARTVSQGTFLFPANRGIGGQGGVGKIVTSEKEYRSLDVGAIQVGQIRVDYRGSFGYIITDGGVTIGGHVWIGGNLGIYGDLRVRGAIRAPGVSRIIAFSTVNFVLTGTTTETDAGTFTVSKNDMGPNGFVEVDATFTCNLSSPSTNVKRMRLRFGSAVNPMAVITVTDAATLSYRASMGVQNQNATNAQEALLGTATFGWGPSGASPPTATEDTTADVICRITMQLGLSSETMTLTRWVARVTYLP